MQWYFASLLILLILAGIGLLTGGLLMTSLPARVRPGARVFLSVPLGWTILALVATLLGWIGHGFADSHCAGITAALALAGAWQGRGWLRHAGGDCLRLGAFCLLASFPILGPLYRHGSFSLYSDTYAYCAHAQWLQHHGFLERARTDGGHPLWGAMLTVQDTPLRVGSEFILAWVQAVFGFDLPLQVFPALAALGLICAALAVGATVLAACPGRWPEAWLAALAVAVTVNGFAFGAAGGFFAQTWGLAFAAAAFALRGLELGTHAGRSGLARWRVGVPVGLCAAASMHCYWDVLPLAGPALGCAYLLPWPGRDARASRAAAARAAVPLGVCLLAVNLEWGRAARGILYNARAVAGNPVAWPAWHFPLHALGLKSSVWERSRWLTQDLPAPVLLTGGAVALGWLLFLLASQRPEHWRHWLRPPARLDRWHWQPLVPALVWTALTVGLFVYFRYAVPSPWHAQQAGAYADGVGQSWSQFKVTGWGSLALICLVAAGGVGWTMRTRSGLGRAALVALLTAWCGTGLGWNYRLAGWRGEQVILDTGVRRDPLLACLAMRQRAAAIPPGDWIYLDWPADGRGGKLRELMVSLLFDHPLASDWSTDIALLPNGAPTDSQRGPADCQWVLHYTPPVPGGAENALAVGGMALEKR